jgi:hypothetical protein
MNTATRSMSFGSASGAVRTGQPGWFAKAGAAIWRALEASGEARARRHILDFADRCEALQPDLAKELRAVSSRD